MPIQNLKFNGQIYQVNIADEADASVLNEIFKFREYRTAEEVIKTAVDPILDVGAHRGFFSLYCRALNDKVKIFALEPEKNNLKAISEHLKQNKISGVKVVPGALAGETGERVLFLSSDSHNHRLAVDASERAENSAPVKAFSLPDFCREFKILSLSLLKMDIVGGEYEVMENLQPADFSLVKNLLLEYHNSNTYKEIEEKLRANGFSVQIFPSQFDKSMGFIFARNKRSVKCVITRSEERAT